MTKIEYIDYMINSLQAADKTNKFHPKQVEAAINFATNTVFYDLYRKNPKSVMKSMERYAIHPTPFTVIYSLGVAKPRYTTNLDFDVVNLPTKGSGIIEILEVDASGDAIIDTTTKFIPVSVIEGRQFYGSESSLPDNIIGYTLTDNRTIEYWGMTQAIANLGVHARIIKQFRYHTDTTDIMLPYGQDEKIMELVGLYMGVDLSPGKN